MDIAIDRINLDFQDPENLIDETVQEYVEQMRFGRPIEPVTVYFDGSQYFLFDGFHRVRAAQILNLPTIFAKVVPGTYQDMERQWRDFLAKLKADLRGEM